MTDKLPIPVQCGHTVEGGWTGPKNRRRPWWRRRCKRTTTDQSGLCWQHR